MSGKLPDKLYFRIGEVASIVGVEPHVLRFWETEFGAIRPGKSSRGHRVYSRKDVDTLLKVKDLLYGHQYTIAGAKRKLRTGGIEPADASEPTQREVQALRTTLEGLRVDITDAMTAIQRLADDESRQ